MQDFLHIDVHQVTHNVWQRKFVTTPPHHPQTNLHSRDQCIHSIHLVSSLADALTVKQTLMNTSGYTYLIIIHHIQYYDIYTYELYTIVLYTVDMT